MVATLPAVDYITDGSAGRALVGRALVTRAGSNPAVVALWEISSVVATLDYRQ